MTLIRSYACGGCSDKILFANIIKSTLSLFLCPFSSLGVVYIARAQTRYVPRLQPLLTGTQTAVERFVELPGKNPFAGRDLWSTNNDAVMVRILRCIGGFQFGVLRTARRYRVHLGCIRGAKECKDLRLALSIVPSAFFDIALLLFYCGRCIYPPLSLALAPIISIWHAWLRPKPKATGDAMFQFQVQPDSARGLYFHVRLSLCQSKTLSHFPIVSVCKYKNRKF